MTPTLLAYQIDPGKLGRMQVVCLRLGIRVQAVDPADFGQPIGALAGVLLILFGRQFLSLFADKPEVIDAGVDRLRIMAFSYFIAPLMDCSIAASRGLGRSVAPTVMVIMGSCVFRVVWIYTVFAFFHTITSLYLLYIVSWIITGVAEAIYFRMSYKKYVLERSMTW